MRTGHVDSLPALTHSNVVCTDSLDYLSFMKQCKMLRLFIMSALMYVAVATQQKEFVPMKYNRLTQEKRRLIEKYGHADKVPHAEVLKALEYGMALKQHGV